MVKTAFLNNFYPCRTLYVSVFFSGRGKTRNNLEKNPDNFFHPSFAQKTPLRNFLTSVLG